MRKKKWNGLCSNQKHGLDFETQICDACAAEVETSRPSRSEAFAELMTRLDKRITEYRNEILIFADCVRGENPLYRLSWADSVFESAARLKVYTEILHAYHNEDRDPRLDVHQLQIWLMDKVICNSKYPKFPTSQCSNLASIYENAAYADVLSDVNDIIKYYKDK